MPGALSGQTAAVSTMLPHPDIGGSFTSPVTPGTGWPLDPADADTPVARTPAGVRRLARQSERVGLDVLEETSSVCAACPRLVTWREDVARDKRASYAAEPYWGRPTTGFGSPTPRVVVMGLAPAAHGGNRTGRIFTGDRSGDWLVASLSRVGLASQPTSVHAADGLGLLHTRMIAAVRCAPPLNKPTPAERAACAPWINAELRLVAAHVRVVVALGQIGWDAALRSFGDVGWQVPRPKPRFGHGAEASIGKPRGGLLLLGSYHPSQQNTFTGRLTAPMLDDVLGRAAARGLAD